MSNQGYFALHICYFITSDDVAFAVVIRFTLQCLQHHKLSRSQGFRGHPYTHEEVHENLERLGDSPLVSDEPLAMWWP